MRWEADQATTGPEPPFAGPPHSRGHRWDGLDRMRTVPGSRWHATCVSLLRHASGGS
jgi:hypothetical protein